jgi:hypothetical protein
VELSKNTNSINVGGSGTTLLTIAFFVAKILGYIDWPWLWVFAPLWLPLAVVLGVILLLGAGYLLLKILE